MSYRSHTPETSSNRPAERGRLRRWSPAGFLAGGVVAGLVWFVESGGRGPLGDLAVSVGLFLAVCAGLVGYYGWLADSTPRLGVFGLAATVAAVLAVTVPAAWTVGAVIAGAPAGGARPDWLVTAFRIAAVAIVVAYLAYGVATFRERTLSAGPLLAVAVVAWYGSMHNFLLGECSPLVVGSARIVFPLALFVLAVALVAEAALLDVDPADWVESPASPETDEWTNEHVQEGFDVDGSESRGGMFGRTIRLGSTALLYELLGRFWDAFHRPDRYDNRRVVGKLVGRPAAVEQGIAEQEYVVTAVTAVERDGIGSARWRIAVVTQLLTVAAILLFMFGSTMLLFGFVAASPVALGVGATIGAAAIATFVTDLRIRRRVGARMDEVL